MQKLTVHDIPALACVGLMVFLFLLQAWACGSIAAIIIAMALHVTRRLK